MMLRILSAPLVMLAELENFTHCKTAVCSCWSAEKTTRTGHVQLVATTVRAPCSWPGKSRL